MAEIFVSYSRNDKEIVFPLVSDIDKELQTKCWIDLNGIESGEQFEDVIIHAIDKSEIVLFMLSDSSLESQWTKREVYYAEAEGKRIVPVIIDGKGLRGWCKFHFGNIDCIEISSIEQKVKLIENLRVWLNKQETKPEKNINDIITMSYDTDEKSNKSQITNNKENPQKSDAGKVNLKSVYVLLPIILVILLSMFFILKPKGSIFQTDFQDSPAKIISKAVSSIWPDSIPIIELSNINVNSPYVLELFLADENLLYAKGKRVKDDGLELFTEKEQIKNGIDGLENYLVNYCTKDGVNPIARMLVARNELNNEININKLDHETYETGDLVRLKKHIELYYSKLDSICEGKLIYADGKLVKGIGSQLTVLIHESPKSKISIHEVIQVLQNCCV